MAIDRFQDENILINSKTPEDNIPLYSSLDSNKMGAPEFKDTMTPFSKTEVHIYSAGNLLQSLEEDTIGRNSQGSDIPIIIKPEDDVRKSTIEKGYYSLVYNFLEPVSPVKLNLSLCDVTCRVSKKYII